MKDHKFEAAPDLASALEAAAWNGARRSVEIDVEKYQAYLDDPALSPDQRDEIIESLWVIMTAFVELGFGVHPVQQSCGQLEIELDPEAGSDSHSVAGEDTGLKQEFNDASER